MASEQTVQIAIRERTTLASEALTQRQAKLYSQRLRKEMGQPGLPTFLPRDVRLHLDDAIMLLDCALIERQADPSGRWREGVRRAAEILEWLSQPDLKPPGTPVHFLAAAAYQVAGYPAMALGHLQRLPDEPFSNVLREFLSGNFPNATEGIFAFWRDARELDTSGLLPADDISVLAVQHTIMCIGTVCSYLRNGVNTTVHRALEKIDSLARGFLHSRDHFSHLLARLTAITCQDFVEHSLWPQIAALQIVSSESAGEALQQFGRAAYLNRRSLVWPAQAAGITRLIVQGLFAETNYETATLETIGLGNLIIYIVPSRAIAAEVEQRLAQDLQGIAPEPVVVTGLYGGVDWGPTDAWIQTGQPAIVICTFEKADALLRYLGILFLNRVRLIVIDEAHMVEQNIGRLDDLTNGSSRSYRLEQLGTRLLYAQDRYQFRLIALSAVASGAAPALARWITSDVNALPVTSEERSTRQMLGRLEVSNSGNFTITYDLMNGRSLSFEDERREDSPYVRAPFPSLPSQILDAGPEARMRVPTLWAALHLASERPDGARPSVLISLTQHVESFAAECADQLDAWPPEILPPYAFGDQTNEQWARCLASAADYFTTQSVEYRLLKRGIAVHHGKMPNLLSRRLKALIDAGYVRVIIATSTLSEGVNIPVNYLLLPNIYRRQAPLSLQEFMNLIGRVGRAGVSTEGHALVVLPELPRTSRGGLTPTTNRQWTGYGQLKNAIQKAVSASRRTVPNDNASSALTHLLIRLERAWRQLTGNSSQEQFTEWLERTAVPQNTDDNPPEAFGLLDSLDTFLIAAIHEIEELQAAELSGDLLEAELVRIWRSTYAFASARQEEKLRRIWLDRGSRIKDHYGDARRRRQIYKTSLSPRSATLLLDEAATIKTKLLKGSDYATMNTADRFAFISEVLALLSLVPSFRLAPGVGTGRNATDWTVLLRWWLAKGTLPSQPRPKQITKWFQFVSENFIYRGAWGIGSLLGLLLDLEGEGQPVKALEIDDWPRSGLPWIAFWLKELLTWGTLDPVAAFLLARGNRLDRPEAESDARAYYENLSEVSPNDALDPRRILRWMETLNIRPPGAAPATPFTIAARLERQADAYTMGDFAVSPIDGGDQLIWINPAGYKLAQSDKPEDWDGRPSAYDFNLDVRLATVSATPYLRYRDV